MAITRSAPLMALLLVAAAVAAANAATVGPWTPFTARVEAAKHAAEAVRVASDAKGSTAAADTQAYGGYYEDAAPYYYERLVQAALQQTAWRQCGQSSSISGGNLLPEYFAQLDFTCAAPNHYGDSYHQSASAFFPGSSSTAMSCSTELRLNTEAYATLFANSNAWLTSGGQAVNIGRISATCRASNVAEECGAPCNKGLVIDLEGDIFVAFVRSTVTTVAKPANGDGSCAFLTNGVTRAEAAVSVAAANKGADAQNYYGHQTTETLTNGVAIVASGTTSVVGLKDKDLRSTGLWEYALAVASTTGNNICQMPFLGPTWCSGTAAFSGTIAAPANTPIVQAGSLELQFFPL